MHNPILKTLLPAKEAAAVERKVRELRDAIAATRRRIGDVSSQIDKQAAPAGQPEISFSVDLRRKTRLRRAIKKAFGVKTETLTYSMYKTALAAKRAIEESEAANYTAGNWEEDE